MTAGRCPGRCVLPAGHRPVHEVLPVPLQVHTASPWVARAYLAKLERTT